MLRRCAAGSKICRRSGLRYREILLWHTQYSMGNAAVMGIIPQMHYILLSDLLLETLTDSQIEAVFAHEIGHIVHRHMAWYVVFFGVMALAALGPGSFLEDWICRIFGISTTQGSAVSQSEAIRGVISAGIALLLTFSVFGYISRRFERQADVYAARMIETDWGARRDEPASAALVVAQAVGTAPITHVGTYGAGVFASALHRVAMINNISVESPSWCHGSIARRMRYLERLSADPTLTGSFDRDMFRLYFLLVASLLVCGAVAALAIGKGL